MHLACVNKMTKHLAEIGVVKNFQGLVFLALEKKERKKTKQNNQLNTSMV